MKIDIRPNLDQIRFYARTAMHAWDYQDVEAGRAQVIADMERLLAYLDAFDDGEGTVVAGVKAIKAGIRIERSTRKGDSLDLCDRYMGQTAGTPDVDDRGRRETGIAIAIDGVGADGLPMTEDEDRNLRSGVNRAAKQ